MMISRIDLGNYFLGEDNEVYILISYASDPTCTLERVRDKERVGGTVGSPNITKFKRLIVEKEE